MRIQQGGALPCMPPAPLEPRPAPPVCLAARRQSTPAGGAPRPAASSTLMAASLCTTTPPTLSLERRRCLAPSTRRFGSREWRGHGQEGVEQSRAGTEGRDKRPLAACRPRLPPRTAAVPLPPGASASASGTPGLRALTAPAVRLPAPAASPLARRLAGPSLSPPCAGAPSCRPWWRCSTPQMCLGSSALRTPRISSCSGAI